MPLARPNATNLGIKSKPLREVPTSPCVCLVRACVNLVGARGGVGFTPADAGAVEDHSRSDWPRTYGDHGILHYLGSGRLE